MRTKEDLEKQIWEAMANGCQLDSDLREDSEGAVTDCANTAISYAKEVAIEFARYINEKKLFEDDISGKPLWYQSENHKFKPLSSERIFNLFKKEKNIQ